MTLCRVTGSVVSTHKNKHLEGYKILIVQPVDLNYQPIGNDMLAIDQVNAGVNDLVIVMKEGGSARRILKNSKNPVQAIIVGVVDGINVPDDQGKK
jgi:ethanolamine utilization protein EutN